MNELMQALLIEKEVNFHNGEDYFSKEAEERIMDVFVQTEEFETDYVECGKVDKVGAKDAAMKRARGTTAFQVAEFENETTINDDSYNAKGTPFEGRG